MYELIIADLRDKYLDKKNSIKVVQLNGSIVQTDNAFVTNGYSLIIDPNNNIKNGMYLLVINNDNESDTTPFILAR
mgnify:CR=1 FL=1